MQSSSHSSSPPVSQEWLSDFLNTRHVNCKICKNLVVPTKEITVSSTAKRNVCELYCPNCKARPRKKGRVYICTLCRKFSTSSKGSIKCTCDKNHIDDLESINDLASENLPTYENNNTIDEANIPIEDYKELNADNSDIASESGEIPSDSSLTDSDHVAFDPKSFFSIDNGFTEASSAFFIAEHNKSGDGKKYIVSKALFRTKGTERDCLEITERQVNLAFHSCERFYKMSTEETSNVCSMIQEEKNAAEERQSMLSNHLAEELYKSLNLNGINPLQCEQIIKESSEKAKSRYLNDINKRGVLPEIQNANAVSKYYTGKGISMLNQLPRPEVKIQSLDEDRAYAFIDPLQLITHVLALGVDCHYYRAGYDEDWDPNKFIDTQSPYMAQVLDSNFFRKTHAEMKEMVENGEIPPETRVAMSRGWSDSFEFFKITSNNEYNSVQVYTIRFKGPEDSIFPVILSFKKDIDRSLILTVVSEMKKFEKMTLLYWGKEKKLIPTIIKFEFMVNDYVERCYNVGISQKGTYAKRFGHSCSFVRDLSSSPRQTPSCEDCTADRISLLLNGNCDATILNPCQKCSDWWSDDIEVSPDEYPHPPSLDIRSLTDLPSVKLSFKMIRNSLRRLEEWNTQNRHLRYSTEALKKYLGLICIGKPAEFHKAMRNSESVVPITSLDCYPPILKEFESLDIDIDFFTATVMHQFFLGCQKKNVVILNHMKLDSNGNDWWESLFDSVQTVQKELMTIPIQWCNVMSFSNPSKDGGSKSKFGTGGWMSDHCVGFCRLSLFQYSHLDEESSLSPPRDEKYRDIIASCRRMIVVWFCLVSNAFSELAVPSTRIDHLVRMFLTACVDFHDRGPDAGKRPFIDNCSNYYSLLNCKELIALFGSLRYIWEGLDEKFIKYIKREVSTMRHDTNQLKILLEKLFCTSLLRRFNDDNPLKYRNSYEKLSDFKVYRQKKTANGQTSIYTPSQVLENLDYISGGVDIHGNFLLCFTTGQNKPIELYEIQFHDMDGVWMLNLWYSDVSIGQKVAEVKERKELTGLFTDHFIMLKHPDVKIQGRRTVICHSWLVRVQGGNLQLPMPREEFLMIYS